MKSSKYAHNEDCNQTKIVTLNFIIRIPPEVFSIIAAISGSTINNAAKAINDHAILNYKEKYKLNRGKKRPIIQSATKLGIGKMKNILCFNSKWLMIKYLQINH